MLNNYLDTNNSYKNNRFSQVGSGWGTEYCAPDAELKVIGNSRICIPKTVCTAETCPPDLGTCVNGTCVYKNGYKGLETYPVAMTTYYCGLSDGGCHGVTQNVYPEVNAGEIANNFGLKLCDQSSDNSKMCIGIAASSPMIVGNSQEARNPDGSYVKDWGQGMTERTGVCYEITGPTGNKAIVALTDRCGGYCKCNGSGMQECGPCVNSSDMRPNVPCVGTVPGLYNTCYGLSKYCGTKTGAKNIQDKGVNVNEVAADCDWCASNNHPHFDLDTGTFNHVCGPEGIDGSCVLSSVQPVKCMTPKNWPPTNGGGGYIQCPSGTWDTGGMNKIPSCESGQYLYPGDPSWPNSETANHLCCVPGTMPIPQPQPELPESEIQPIPIPIPGPTPTPTPGPTPGPTPTPTPSPTLPYCPIYPPCPNLLSDTSYTYPLSTSSTSGFSYGYLPAIIGSVSLISFLLILIISIENKCFRIVTGVLILLIIIAVVAFIIKESVKK